MVWYDGVWYDMVIQLVLYRINFSIFQLCMNDDLHLALSIWSEGINLSVVIIGL